MKDAMPIIMDVAKRYESLREENTASLRNT